MIFLDEKLIYLEVILKLIILLKHCCTIIRNSIKKYTFKKGLYINFLFNTSN